MFRQKRRKGENVPTKNEEWENETEGKGKYQWETCLSWQGFRLNKWIVYYKEAFMILGIPVRFEFCSKKYIYNWLLADQGPCLLFRWAQLPLIKRYIRQPQPQNIFAFSFNCVSAKYKYFLQISNLFQFKIATGKWVTPQWVWGPCACLFFGPFHDRRQIDPFLPTNKMFLEPATEIRTVQVPICDIIFAQRLTLGCKNVMFPQKKHWWVGRIDCRK